jgi:hypothetical protein
MPTLKKTEDLKITYDNKKIRLEGKALSLEMDLPVQALLAIYSSGYGMGLGTFTIKIPDEYQKISPTNQKVSALPEIPKASDVVVPNSIFPPFNSIPEGDKPVNTDTSNSAPQPSATDTPLPNAEPSITQSPSGGNDILSPVKEEEITIEVIEQDKEVVTPVPVQAEKEVKTKEKVVIPIEEPVTDPVQEETDKPSYEEFEEVDEKQVESKSSTKKTLDDVKKENPWYLPRQYSETG